MNTFEKLVFFTIHLFWYKYNIFPSQKQINLSFYSILLQSDKNSIPQILTTSVRNDILLCIVQLVCSIVS